MMSMNRIVRNVVLCCCVLALPGGNAISLKHKLKVKAAAGNDLPEAFGQVMMSKKQSTKDESLIPGNHVTKNNSELYQLFLEEKQAYNEYMKRVEYLKGSADNKFVKKLAPYIDEKGWAALRKAPTADGTNKQHGEKTGQYLFVKEISDFEKGKVIVVLRGKVNEWKNRRAYFTKDEVDRCTSDMLSQAMAFRVEDAKWSAIPTRTFEFLGKKCEEPILDYTIHQIADNDELREFEFSVDDLLSLVAPKNAHEEKYGDIAAYVSDDESGNIWAQEKLFLRMKGNSYDSRKTNYKQNWMKFTDFDKESRTIVKIKRTWFCGYSNWHYQFKNKNDQTSSEYQKDLDAGKIKHHYASLDPSPYVHQQKSCHTGFDDLHNYSKAIKAWTWRPSVGLVERFNLQTLK